MPYFEPTYIPNGHNHLSDRFPDICGALGSRQGNRRDRAGPNLQTTDRTLHLSVCCQSRSWSGLRTADSDMIAYFNDSEGNHLVPYYDVLLCCHSMRNFRSNGPFPDALTLCEFRIYSTHFRRPSLTHPPHEWTTIPTKKHHYCYLARVMKELPERPPRFQNFRLLLFCSYRYVNP